MIIQDNGQDDVTLFQGTPITYLGDLPDPIRKWRDGRGTGDSPSEAWYFWAVPLSSCCLRVVIWVQGVVTWGERLVNTRLVAQISDPCATALSGG